MTQQEFDHYFLHELRLSCTEIAVSARQLHASVGQTYGPDLPYAVHLDAVADALVRLGAECITSAADILPVFFAAYYHDSIEDARLTYNDVVRTARQHMDEQAAHIAAEAVYALTNEKGRTRAERANEHYYEGIRTTPYAPMLKLCDRLANTTFSSTHNDLANQHMREVYTREWPHFLAAIRSPLAAADPRYALPQPMLQAIQQLHDS